MRAVGLTEMLAELAYVCKVDSRDSCVGKGNGMMDASWLPALKRRILTGLRAVAEAGVAGAGAALAAVYRPDSSWRGAHPLGDHAGPAALAEHVWAPLLAAMPDLERRDLIFVGGDWQGRTMLAAMGHYCGTFTRDWLGIPATGRAVFLRYGEVHRIENGAIAESWCLWDLLDLMRQAGVWPLARSLGVETMWPAPFTADGVVLHETDPAEGAANLAQTLAMHRTLGDYDDNAGLGRGGLLAMPQRDHWHPRMMWYGPAGIGSMRGLAGFVDDHQLPFRLGFPNRRGGIQLGGAGEGGHYIRIGDGGYSVTGGWPSVRGQHLGGDFMGLPPTGREIEMRVMDFYLHHEGLIRENWVPIDIIDILRQMDVDVFARLARLRGQRG